jgi:hypothetical protein
VPIARRPPCQPDQVPGQLHGADRLATAPYGQIHDFHDSGSGTPRRGTRRLAPADLEFPSVTLVRCRARGSSVVSGRGGHSGLRHPVRCSPAGPVSYRSSAAVREHEGHTPAITGRLGARKCDLSHDVVPTTAAVGPRSLRRGRWAKPLHRPAWPRQCHDSGQRLSAGSTATSPRGPPRGQASFRPGRRTGVCSFAPNDRAGAAGHDPCLRHDGARPGHGTTSSPPILAPNSSRTADSAPHSRDTCLYGCLTWMSCSAPGGTSSRTLYTLPSWPTTCGRYTAAPRSMSLSAAP